METLAGSSNSRKRCTDSFDLSSRGGSVLSVNTEGGAWGGKEAREGQAAAAGFARRKDRAAEQPCECPAESESRRLPGP